MAGNEPSIKDLAQMINSVMGQRVLSEQQLQQIIQGAKNARERGGMNAVLEYLMKVTQADVDMGELQKFAKEVEKNPNQGMEILKGKRKLNRKRN